MKTKKQRDSILQQQADEDSSIMFNWLFSMKGLDSTLKILLNYMCNDIFMNDKITWKQMTYADKVGLSRPQIWKWFKKLEEADILIPCKDNKAGAKNNTYTLTYRNIRTYAESNLNKNNNLLTGGTQPVNQEKQTCYPPLTYNKVNKTNKVLITKGEEEDLASSSPDQKKTISDHMLYEFMNEISKD